MLIIGPAAINPVKVVDAPEVGVAAVAEVCPPLLADEPPLLPTRARAPTPAPKPNKLNDGVADATALDA